MKAMLLAAGFGKRMMPLTASTPKPLLKVAGKPLIEWTILSLVKANIRDIVINHAYLGSQIVDYLGDGGALGANIRYSEEEQPLETAGGIAKTLDAFGDNPFVVVNADIYTDFDFSKLVKRSLSNNTLAHLVMVDNPVHNTSGDFSISSTGILQRKASDTYTFSGISVLSPELFKHYQCFDGPLQPLFLSAIDDRLASAEYYSGRWTDVGTPERLKQLEKELKA